MDIPEHIFKSYDIRGLYPQEINEENVVSITKAIYKLFQQKLDASKPLTVAIGQDMRTSSPAIAQAVIKTLVEAGANVIDLGLVSTPTFYFAVSKYSYDAGIVITASHNPKEYNGLKFVVNSGHGLIKIGKPTGMEDVKKMAVEGVTLETVNPGTVTKKENVVDDEVDNAIKILENPEIKKFKIVADTANAMGAVYIDKLFEKVPAELVRMNFTLDGTFPVHQADPMQPENLVDLQKKVLEEKADFGLAPDGDGDRLFIIDEKGNVVSPSLIIGILSKELLSKNPGAKVVVDLKYQLTARKIVEEYGGELLVSKTGHAFITDLMTRENALFAGEASAHYYYRFTGNAESQVITIMSVLKIMTEEGKPLSAIAEEFRRSYESGEINFEVNNSLEIMEKLHQKYSDGTFSDLDGVSFEYPDWRVNLRNSNTEPLLRLNVEAQTRELMEQKRDEIKAFVESVKS